MHTIHPKSNITTLPDYDIFTVPPTQNTIDKIIVTEHRPINPLKSYTPIQFEINTAVDEYVHLKDTNIYLKMRIDIQKKAPGDIVAADWDAVTPVNNFLHSIFKSVDFEINNTSLTRSPMTYPYKAYMETLLGYTNDSKQGHLSSLGYYVDFDYKDAIKPSFAKMIVPDPVTTDGKGRTIELYGKLHLDLFLQPKALIGGTSLRLKLIPHSPSFYMWNLTDSLKNVSVTFEDCCIYLTRSKVNPLVVEAHNLALMKAPARYPLTRGEVKTFAINSGRLDAKIENCFSGKLPRRMFVMLVDNAAYNGTLKENPFAFYHYNLEYLSASIDGEPYPSIPYRPDFANNLYMREYMSVYEALDGTNTDSVFDLKYNEYRKGNVMYGFAFGNDMCEDCNKAGYVNPVKYGAINLQMKFSQPLPKTINVLLYAEFDNILEIDASRQPIINYT